MKNNIAAFIAFALVFALYLPSAISDGGIRWITAGVLFICVYMSFSNVRRDISARKNYPVAGTKGEVIKCLDVSQKSMDIYLAELDDHFEVNEEVTILFNKNDVPTKCFLRGLDPFGRRNHRLFISVANNPKEVRILSVEEEKTLSKPPIFRPYS